MAAKSPDATIPDKLPGSSGIPCKVSTASLKPDLCPLVFHIETAKELGKWNRINFIKSIQYAPKESYG
jgi:hypothetical protein